MLANWMLVVLLATILITDKGTIRLYKSPAFALIIVASVSYLILSVCNGYEIPLSALSLRFIAPIILFYLGYQRGLKGIQIIKADVTVMMFGSFLHGAMNVFVNRGKDVLEISGRAYDDIYGGTVSATIQNLFFVLSSALLFYFLVCEKRPLLKIGGVFAGLFGMYASVVNASRTILVVSAAIFVLCLIAYLLGRFGIGGGLYRFFVIGISVAIVACLVIGLDLFGICEWFANTALGRRESISSGSASIWNNPRWIYTRDIIKLIPQYPFGNIPYANYAHNLWIDIAKEAGIIPLLLYLAFTILSAVQGIAFFRNKAYHLNDRIFAISVIVAYLLVFCTEPIIEGAPLTFSIFCFVVGGISAVRRRTKMEKLK